jgi:hypothetical protein
MDRICGVPSDHLRPFFGHLRMLAGWATSIAASHHHRDSSETESAAGGSPTTGEPAIPDDSPVVAVAVAIGALLNYYRRLGSHYLASSTGATSLQGTVPVDVVLERLQVASGTAAAPLKAAVAAKLLERGVEELGEFVLPLAFACIVSNAASIRDKWEEVLFVHRDPATQTDDSSSSSASPAATGHHHAQPHTPSPRSHSSGIDGTFNAPFSSGRAVPLQIETALRHVMRLAEVLPVTKETADLLSSLPHPTHLLVVMDRVAWLDEIAATTPVENADEVHDLNENLQPLVSSSWLERTDKVLRQRGKGSKWLRSPQAITASHNPTAVSKHMRWCRAAHRCIESHQTNLPIIASFAVVADHPQASQFFKSLALASQHRLAEMSTPGVVLQDWARFVMNPRTARLDRITVRQLLRIAEIDVEFLPQLATFEPRTAYN